MTFKDQLFALYSPDERLLIEKSVNELGLPDNDLIFFSLIETRKATLAAQKAEEAARVAEEKADRALTAAQGATDTLARAVGASLDEARGIQRSLGVSGLLMKALISRIGSAILTLTVLVIGFLFLQGQVNSQLQKFIAEENKLTSSSNAAMVEKSLELARRGNFNATACYALASALSLPTTKATWDPKHGAGISFPISSGVQVCQTNNEVQVLFPRTETEEFHKILKEIADGGFLDLAKEANTLSKPSSK